MFGGNSKNSTEEQGGKVKLAAALTIAFAIPLFLEAQQHPQLPEGWKYIGSGYMRGPNGLERLAPPAFSPGTPWDPLVFAAPVPFLGDARNPIHIVVQTPAQPQAQERKSLLLETLLLRGIQDVYQNDWNKISDPDREYILELKRQLQERPRVIF
jgi:hypothetical protein